MNKSFGLILVQQLRKLRSSAIVAIYQQTNMGVFADVDFSSSSRTPMRQVALWWVDTKGDITS